MKESKWFAVYTRPKWEKKVTELLEKKKIKAYCPLNKNYKEWGDKRRVVNTPLFSSHVFVQLTERDFSKVIQTRGVVSFFYWLGKPAIVSNEEISAIEKFLNEYPDVKLEKTLVRPDEPVELISSPLILRKGNVLEVRNNTVKVMLPSLGQMLIADIRKDAVEESIAYIEDEKIRV
jgi:transcription termination/antitermination protein NusG